MLGRIQAMNLNSKLIHPNMKAHLFKTNSVLWNRKSRTIENLKKLEGNAIKKQLRIPVRCKTSDLVDSLIFSKRIGIYIE
jgi:hypothetical protein